MKLEELQNYLDGKSQELGFSHYGVSSLSRPLSFEVYENWIAEGLHGNMEYLSSHAPIKEKPQTKWPKAQSALVFAVPYYPHPAQPENFPLKEARVSLYAQGYDYHLWFKAKLQNICDDLKGLYPDEEFVPMTDSSPVLERDLAYRAGLGWVGKNTCVIHPKKGSLFFIGEIYSSLPLTLDVTPVHDFCGTCTRCIDICPTGAITEPRKLDARKCISYLTIESRELPPVELREKIGDWLFGCDLCQTTCPWNQKAFKNQLSTELIENKTEDQAKALEEELRWLLASSGKSLERSFQGTALSRAGGFGLKRNAIIVANNRNLASLAPEIEALLDHPKLGELAKWALTKLKPES
ncbi:tRNA epoxyqueuosine(34) reductase QueG [Bdellovibrio sp. HCB337]|uniref:tRNA epoxyqueuosine(34) reductase QueG n=1 Tax=Bdellovibrio sp. HCB337 TaxID=3394358 RepID=UPI0039A4960E